MITDHRNRRVEALLLQAGKWHAVLVIVLAIAVLLSWQFDWRFLKQPIDRFVSMNPLTAVFFVVSALSYLAQLPSRGMSIVRSAVFMAMGLMGVLAALRLAEVFWGIGTSVDNLLFAQKLENETVNSIPNRMAPNTALCFLLLAPGLSALRLRGRIAIVCAQISATPVLLISILSLLGYLYQVPEFYGPLVNYTPMAIHTALAFFFTALAILYAMPDRGLVGVFTTRLAGSRSAMILIPAILLVPTVLGYLRLRGHWGRIYPVEFGVAVLMLAIMVILFTLAWINARALNRQHAMLLESEQQLSLLNKQLEIRVEQKTTSILRTEGRLQHILDTMLEGVQIIDRNWLYLYVNEATAKQAQKPTNWLLGRRVLDLYPGFEKTDLFGRFMHTMQHKEPQHLETAFHHPDGRIGWYEMTIQPIPEGIFILSVDVTERHRVEQALHEANEGLEKQVAARTAQLTELNTELEAFSYSVSHDLRAPLHTIKGYAAMLADLAAKNLTPEQQELVRVIDVQAGQMETLIKSLLDLAKYGSQAIQPRAVNVQNLVAEICSDLVDKSETAIEWVVHNLPEVVADPELLQRALTNLLANAVKYTAREDKPRIEISSETLGNEIIFHIQDNGVGYDMAYADRLFGPFQRLHQSGEFEGSGIGLAIVQRIVHRHGGRVWASAEPGKGATFSFSLPRIY